MNRRDMIVTLSGVMATSALIAGPALAQTSPGPTLSMAKFKAKTLMAGTYSKQTSELAIAQATHPKVKEFGQFEANEQTAVAQVLTDINNPPPAPLDPKHAALLQQLQGMSGKAFDAAYVQGQIDGHQELLNIQQAFLNGVPLSHDYRHVAILSRMAIQMHLTMLQDLQGQLAA